MTKRARTILFFTFFAIFLFATPVMILYSQGYRFDFERKRLTQTGGLFVKVVPKQAEIYVDSKLVKKTDFFFSTALIENLLPKKHQVEVRKEGFYSWKKNLEIKEKEVAEARNIVLFNQALNFSLLSKKISDFWFSSDEKKIILKSYDTLLSQQGKESWILSLYDLDKKVKTHLINEGDISKTGAEIINLKFSNDLRGISLEVKVQEKSKYFNLAIDKTPSLLEEIKEPAPLPIKNSVVSQILNNAVYYLDNSGYLWKSDSSFSFQEKISEHPFPLKEGGEYELNIYSDNIFLKEGQILYKFSSDSKSFEKFFEGISDLKISPDFGKLVYFSNSEIWILFLRDEINPPKRKAGESVFLIRLAEKIKGLFWLNSDYLIFQTGDKIKIVEIDDRDRVNIVDFAEFKDSQIFWNQTDKKLYILADGIFYASDPLIK